MLSPIRVPSVVAISLAPQLKVTESPLLPEDDVHFIRKNSRLDSYCGGFEQDQAEAIELTEDDPQHSDRFGPSYSTPAPLQPCYDDGVPEVKLVDYDFIVKGNS